MVAIHGAENVVIATPAHLVRAAHAVAYAGVSCVTYHTLMSFSGSLAGWDRHRMAQRRQLPKAVVWDEINMVPLELLQAFMPALRSHGIQVVACGDPGQLPAFAAKEADEADAWLRNSWAEHIVTSTADYRALDAPLIELKKRMWREDDVTQEREARAALPLHSFAELCEQWHPRDVVLCGTHEMGAAVSACLADVHTQRYPTEPVPIRISSCDEARHNGKPVAVPGTDRIVENYVGVLERVPLAALQNLPAPWVPSRVNTIHAFQGQTVGAASLAESPRLWLIDHRLRGWTSNAIYTAVSRVRWSGQLALVTPPGAAVAVDVGAPLTRADMPHICARIALHRNADVKAGRTCSLTATDVLALAASTTTCPCCDTPVAWRAAPRSANIWSIDRKDDSKGHTLENCRITCYTCNVRHIK